MEAYYKEQIKKYQETLHSTQKLEVRLSFSRLAVFIATLIVFYLTMGKNLIVAAILLAAGLIFFALVLKYHLSTIRKRIHLQYLVTIQENELSCINGNYMAYPDGKEYMDKDHPYTSDLDIFGKSSLFQYINRTTSKPGSDKLADWLKCPTSKAEILIRHEIVSELKELTGWRQNLMAIGYQFDGSAGNPKAILDWSMEEPMFTNKKYLKIAIQCLSFLSFASMAGWFFGLSYIFILLIIAINFIILNNSIKNINQIHRNVSKAAELLKSYVENIKLIENQNFVSHELIELQRRFKLPDSSASEKIKAFSGLVDKLNYRLNILISIPLNLFYFWDIRQVYKLEKWKIQNRGYLARWFDTMAEFEALSSLANLYFNNPEWILPVINEQHFRFRAIAMSHPLIPKNRKVYNDFEIDKTGKMVIITGSNMSGKSTFLRTCGINIVLAMTGAPVCAKSLEVSNVTVFTSMRINDSLEENTSSFYAELKRLGSIIQTVERNEYVFLLLDEILRGTNSNDRHLGSVTLIKQLISANAVGILATHDLSLSNIESGIQQKIDNYNFDVKVENDELFFDYKLMKGVCNSLNASILMRKMGIKIQ